MTASQSYLDFADLDQARQILMTHLFTHGGWQTRKQLCETLHWCERQVRDVAESMGADIVRGQAGFKLTDLITRDEMGLAIQAADAFLSQSTKMAAYALALKRRLHAKLG